MTLPDRAREANARCLHVPCATHACPECVAAFATAEVRRALEEHGAETARAMALTEAALIVAMVAELSDAMASPFKEAANATCEEIIMRLEEAGALKVDEDRFCALMDQLTAPGAAGAER